MTTPDHWSTGASRDEMAATWARANGLRPDPRLRKYRCAHGLLRKRPPWPCCREHQELLDHARLWLDDHGPAVLLAHTYLRQATAVRLAARYADEHGLTALVGDPADAWYGFGAVSVRFEVTP